MFTPEEGTALTVQLPNEAIRATITRVIDPNTIEAALNLAAPFTRVHGFNYGDVVRFRRTPDKMFGERWIAADPPRSQPRLPGKIASQPIVAAPDERLPLPERPKIKEKAKRRSDIAREEAGKAKAKK